MRTALTTVGVACATCAIVLTSAWGVQAIGLPPPPRADLIGARAAAWLYRYRLVESAMRIDDGPVVRGACLQGWFPAHGGRGRIDRGTFLDLSDGITLVSVHSDGLDVDGRHEARGLPLAQLELAGCSRILAPRLAAALQSGVPFRISRATAGGRPAIELHIPTRRTSVDLYVAPKTYRPLAVSVTSAHYDGRSTLRLVRLTSPVLRAIEGRS